MLSDFLGPRLDAEKFSRLELFASSCSGTHQSSGVRMIGVDIAPQIAHQFGKNTAETAWAQMKAPSQLNTVMRAKEVTEHQITSVRTKTVDQMIVVDTSMFGFADFTSALSLIHI